MNKSNWVKETLLDWNNHLKLNEDKKLFKIIVYEYQYKILKYISYSILRLFSKSKIFNNCYLKSKEIK